MPSLVRVVRISDFWRLMGEEFGAEYARSLAEDLVLTVLSGRTAMQALEAGLPPKQVWQAICDAQDVPLERRLGRDLGRRSGAETNSDQSI